MPSERDFVHLHLHTEYSLLDGASRCSEVAQTAADWGMPAVALTDHGNMFGTIPFYLACQKVGVKPILGVEAYIVPEGQSRLPKEKIGRDGEKERLHFTLLAQNETGYRNLLKIVSDSWLNGFYYKARMDRELLEAHHDGLIATSACLGGEIPQAILNGNPESAKRHALYWQEVFGRNNYFLELMDHHTPEQQQVNRALVELSKDTGVPLIATNDVHYVKDTDADPQDLLLCIQTGCTHSDPKRMRMSSRELFFRSGKQMWELFGDLPDALLRTVEIAERCDVKLKFGDLVLPEFPVPDGHTPASYLRELCEQRVRNFYSTITPEIRQRLDYELKVIDDKGYSAYFLIVWDLIDFAKQRGIRVGPGRGSAAGSIVAYVLGITELDPLEFDLFFERFLNPERPSAPDVDIDFPPEHREKVVAYTIEKYGVSRTAKIITFGTMGAKAAIKDVGRVMDMPIAQVNELSSLVPDRVGVTIDKALAESEELRRRSESDEQVNRLIETAKRLEGMARHTSIHAAALVIARDDLDNYVPLCRVSGGTDVVTQFDMGAIDKIGLLKMDFLGLRTMTVIDEACRMVRERYGPADFDVRTAPMDDAKTYELISRGDVVGVFQLESGGFQRVCRDLRPDRIDDIVALVALYRPGPMEYIPDYIARKHGQKPVEYLHPLLEPILRTTYGIIVYQEQVMQIGRDLAGFSLGEADQIRKAVGKKDKETMDKVFTKFAAGCAANGIDSHVVQRLIADITTFANYAFNKAHSACYAVVAYWTAYLKANYPKEFMAAQLTSVMDKRDKLVNFVQDTRQMGIEVQLPCVNTGGVLFEVHEEDIVYGMGAINGVSPTVAETIVAERTVNGPFADLYDLCRRTDPKSLAKAALEKLIKAGAGRAFGNRRQLLEGYEAIWEAASRAQADAATGQASLFAELDDSDSGSFLAPQLRPLPEHSLDELRTLDGEMLGLVLFENPLGELHATLRTVALDRDLVVGLSEVEADAEVLLAGLVEEATDRPSKAGKPMVRLRLNDGTGSVTVLVMNSAYDKYRQVAVTGEVIVVVGRAKRDRQDGSGPPAIFADRLLELKDWKKARTAAQRIGQTRPAGNGHHDANGTNGTNGKASPEGPDEDHQWPPAEPVFTGYAALNVRLRVGEGLPERLRRVAGILRQHPGRVPVMLWLEDGLATRRLRLTDTYATSYDDEVDQKLSAVEGCRAQAVE